MSRENQRILDEALFLSQKLPFQFHGLVRGSVFILNKNSGFPFPGPSRGQALRECKKGNYIFSGASIPKSSRPVFRVVAAAKIKFNRAKRNSFSAFKTGIS